MTSEERHEARYRRRKAERQRQRDARSEACGSFEQVFSYEHLYRAGRISIHAPLAGRDSKCAQKSRTYLR